MLVQFGNNWILPNFTASSNLAVLGIFLIQLFPNWTACSPITYTTVTIPTPLAIGNLSNDDGDGNENATKQLGLMSKNNRSAHAFLYISLLSSAKQQREMAKFNVLWRT